MSNRRVSPLPTRRTVLAGAAGGGFLAISARAEDGRPGTLRPRDLAGADGTASELSRARMGSRVRVRGYLGPSLDGRSFVLSDGSPMPCGLCGTIHDIGASLAALSDAPVSGAPEIAIVEGRLVVDDGGRPAIAFAAADLRSA